MTTETGTNIIPAQLLYFDRQSIHAKPVASFNPYLLSPISSSHEEDIRVGIAVDLGGSRLSWASFRTINGRIIQSIDTVLKPSHLGKDYLKWLEDLAKSTGTLPIGISSTGSIEGTALKRTNNVPTFKAELDDKYGGDFAGLFTQSSKVTVINDAVAGAMGTLYDLVASTKLPPAIKNAIYLINGSGINAAVWQDDQIWSTELGAVKIDPSLTAKLGLDETDIPQVRPIAAGKGIEARWKNRTGEELSGEEISRHYQAGHPLAERLYDDSALVATHVVAGLSQNFNLFRTAETTLLICHGGVFSVPGYVEQLRQYLQDYFGFMPQLEIRRTPQENPGLKGAAIAALCYIMGYKHEGI